MSVKQVKEPGQVQPDIVMGPGVRPQQGGKAKKEANIECLHQARHQSGKELKSGTTGQTRR